jgi:nucleotide-binding universal stress UspA family protein
LFVYGVYGGARLAQTVRPRITRLFPTNPAEMLFDVTARCDPHHSFRAVTGLSCVYGEVAMNTAGAKTRIAFKNILFATDFSYLADAALPYVLETAKLYGSKVYAVHVRRRGATWDRPEQAAVTSLQERLKDFPSEVLVEDGEVQPTLLRTMVEKDIDLTVVSTHGRTGLGRVLLGSVAEGIFRGAPCPVLTVGPRLVRDPEWALKIKEILYATDITPASQGAAKYAISLAQENQARLTILNVQPLPKAGELIESEHYITATLRQLQELVSAEAQLWCEPYCLVEQGDPAEKILDVAARYRADLIVLGIRPHGVGMATHVVRPTAHRVVAGATCPVLTVRE